MQQAERFRNVKAFPAGRVAAGIGMFIITWFISGLLPFRPLVVASGSMSPAMNVGDIAVIAKMPPQSLGVSDILVFRKETSTVMHRVTKISSRGGIIYFDTQGDANNAPDAPPVESKNVEGKVLFTIPKLGQISIALKHLLPSNH